MRTLWGIRAQKPLHGVLGTYSELDSLGASDMYEAYSALLFVLREDAQNPRDLVVQQVALTSSCGVAAC